MAQAPQVAFAPGTADDNIGSVPSGSQGLMSQEMEDKYGNFRTLYSSRKSQVYRAIEKSTGETVVVKVYKKKELRPHEVRQVQRERILFLQIDHQYLIKGLGTYECPRAFYLIQEFASRGDLCDIASAFSRRCIPEHHVVKKIAGPMLKGLAYLHARHIIHRDIKPENVLVMEDGTVKLCDFGLAVNASVDVPVSRVGTLEFMAPEVVRLKNTPQDTLKAREEGVPLYNDRVDVWSTGCVIFEMLFGVSPFTDTDRQRIEINILSQPLTIPSNPPISEPVQRFISATLVRSPLARMSAEQLLELPVFTTGIGSDEPQPGNIRNLPRRFSAPYKPAVQMPRGPDNMSGSQFVAGSHYGDVDSMDTAASPGGGGGGDEATSAHHHGSHSSHTPASSGATGGKSGGFLSNTMRFFGGGKKDSGGASGSRDLSPSKNAPVRSSLITGRRSMPRAVHLPPEMTKTASVEKRLGKLGFGGN